MRIIIRFLVFSTLSMFAACVTAAQPRVSIIIDDMGYRATDQLAFSLPRHITFAILPHTQQSAQFSLAAHRQGRTVMLHLPMETLHPRNLGQGALMATMSADSIAYTLDQALQTVPHAVGVNNHMGSKLTQLTFPMTMLMEELVERELFFIDSRTTRFTKAYRIATQAGVPVLQRKVFLDHELNETFIQEQFFRLIRLSKKYGHAIGIAHPHPLSLEVLQALVAQESEVDFVAVTELFEQPRRYQYAPATAQSKPAPSNDEALISELSPAN